jgi:hypothetical protein
MPCSNPEREWGPCFCDYCKQQAKEREEREKPDKDRSRPSYQELDENGLLPDFFYEDISQH